MSESVSTSGSGATGCGLVSGAGGHRQRHLGLLGLLGVLERIVGVVVAGEEGERTGGAMAPVDESGWLTGPVVEEDEIGLAQAAGCFACTYRL